MKRLQVVPLDMRFVVAWYDGYTKVCLRDLPRNKSLNAADIVMKRSYIIMNPTILILVFLW